MPKKHQKIWCGSAIKFFNFPGAFASIHHRPIQPAGRCTSASGNRAETTFKRTYPLTFDIFRRWRPNNVNSASPMKCRRSCTVFKLSATLLDKRTNQHKLCCFLSCCYWPRFKPIYYIDKKLTHTHTYLLFLERIYVVMKSYTFFNGPPPPNH